MIECRLLDPNREVGTKIFVLLKVSLDDVAGFEGYILGLTDLEQQSLFIVEIWLYEIVNRIPF